MTNEEQRHLTGDDLVTHSRMQCFKTCRRKHLFQYIYRVRRERGEALRMGSMVHAALDLLKTDKTLTQVASVVSLNYLPLIEAQDTIEGADAMRLEEEKVWRLVEGWSNRWQDGDATAIASELPFELPIVNPETGRQSRTYRVAGKIDGLSSVDSRVLLDEHKTTGEGVGPDSSLWQKVRIDTQVTLYMVAAHMLGHRVSGVFYDLIRKPGIGLLSTVPVLDSDGLKIVQAADGKRVYKANGTPRQSASKADGWTVLTRAETVLEYGERLRADIAERPDFYYARREIPRFQYELDEMAAELWQIAQDMRQAELAGHHFRNSGACASPYPCEFLECCANGTDLGTDPLPEGFVRVDYIHPELREEQLNATTTETTGDETPACCGGDPDDNGKPEVVQSCSANR